MIEEKNSLLAQIEESTRALKEAFRRTDGDFQSSQEELNDQKVSVNRLRSASVNLKLTKERAENELWRTQRELWQLGELISSHHDEMSLLKRCLNDCKGRNNALSAQIDEVEMSNEALLEELHELNAHHEEACEELSASREWNEKLCAQFLDAEMRSQELAKELGFMEEQHKHCHVVRGSLEHNKKEVVVRRQQLDNLKSRDERVALLLVKLASSIKGQGKNKKTKVNSGSGGAVTKSCILYPFKQIVPRKKHNNNCATSETFSSNKMTLSTQSFSSKYQEPFGMLQEIIEEFIPNTR